MGKKKSKKRSLGSFETVKIDRSFKFRYSIATLSSKRYRPVSAKYIHNRDLSWNCKKGPKNEAHFFWKIRYKDDGALNRNEIFGV